MHELTPAQKRHQTMLAKYGSEEAYREAQKEWTSKGGYATSAKGGGFKAFTPEQRSEAGKKGHQAMINNIIKEKHDETHL